MEAWNQTLSIRKSLLSGRLAGIFPWNPSVVLNNHMVIDTEIAARQLPQPALRLFTDINSRVITDSDAFDEIRGHAMKVNPQFPLTDFDDQKGYYSEFFRLADLALQKCSLFTPFEPLLNLPGAHHIDCAPDNWSDTQLAFQSAHMPKISDFSNFRSRPQVTVPDVLAEYQTICLIHEGSIYTVSKVMRLADGATYCLKTIKPRISDLFESRGIHDCFGKLCFLNDHERTDEVWGTIGSRATEPATCCFLHNYYPFTLETLLANGVSFSHHQFKYYLFCMIESL
jgi:hypothetical protein